jgi:hypothetical protein
MTGSVAGKCMQATIVLSVSMISGHSAILLFARGVAAHIWSFAFLCVCKTLFWVGAPILPAIPSSGPPLATKCVARLGLGPTQHAASQFGKLRLRLDAPPDYFVILQLYCMMH